MRSSTSRRGTVYRVQLVEEGQAGSRPPGGVPHPGVEQKDVDQPGLFDLRRFHAVFTTSDLDTVAADKIHRQRTVIEQVNADLKASALAHLPSGKFAANAAWLVLAVMAFNLARTAGVIAGTGLAKVTTAAIRRTIVTVAARITRSARRLVLHLSVDWR